MAAIKYVFCDISASSRTYSTDISNQLMVFFYFQSWSHDGW